MARYSQANNERGAAAVEMALVLPMLIALVFGIIEFGRAYNAKLELSSAVREGARSLAIGTPLAQITTTVSNAAAGLDPTKLTITTSGSPCAPGGNATVTASYPFTYTIPPFFTQATTTLTASGAMRCEL